MLKHVLFYLFFCCYKQTSTNGVYFYKTLSAFTIKGAKRFERENLCSFVRGMSFSKIFVYCNEVFIEITRKETVLSPMNKIMMNEAVTLA